MFSKRLPVLPPPLPPQHTHTPTFFLNVLFLILIQSKINKYKPIGKRCYLLKRKKTIVQLTNTVYIVHKTIKFEMILSILKYNQQIYRYINENIGCWQLRNRYHRTMEGAILTQVLNSFYKSMTLASELNSISSINVRIPVHRIRY